MTEIAPGATLPDAETLAEDDSRVFKTAWFSKEAQKALIKDKELCEAIEEVKKGQCDDLGGGVFKKRLDKNRHRSIVLAKGGRFWIYTYLFAKKDRENIDAKELVGFKDLAKSYETLKDAQLSKLLKSGQLLEICNEDEV